MASSIDDDSPTDTPLSHESEIYSDPSENKYYYQNYIFCNEMVYNDFYKSKIINGIGFLLGSGFIPLFLGITGIVTNIMNLIVFKRQGLLADGCTPSLVGLSVVDLFVCLVVGFEAFFDIPFYLSIMHVRYTDMQCFIYTGRNVAYGVSEIGPMLKQVSTYITFYLSLERMISVAFPFKVRIVFTPTRSYLVILLFFILGFLMNIAGLLTTKVEPIVLEHRIVIWISYSDSVPDAITSFFKIVNDTILRPICVLSVLLFNIIMISKVVLSMRFKKAKASTVDGKHAKITSLSKQDNRDLSNPTRVAQNEKKEIKLILMVFFISIIFIVCYIPRIMVTFGVYVLPRFGYKAFPNVFYNIIVPINRTLEMLNSSINFFIYKALSSRFKKELRSLCIGRVQ